MDFWVRHFWILFMAYLLTNSKLWGNLHWALFFLLDEIWGNWFSFIGGCVKWCNNIYAVAIQDLTCNIYPINDSMHNFRERRMERQHEGKRGKCEEKGFLPSAQLPFLKKRHRLQAQNWGAQYLVNIQRGLEWVSECRKRQKITKRWRNEK